MYEHEKDKHEKERENELLQQQARYGQGEPGYDQTQYGRQGGFEGLGRKEEVGLGLGVGAAGLGVCPINTRLYCLAICSLTAVNTYVEPLVPLQSSFNLDKHRRPYDRKQLYIQQSYIVGHLTRAKYEHICTDSVAVLVARPAACTREMLIETSVGPRMASKKWVAHAVRDHIPVLSFWAVSVSGVRAREAQA